MSTTPITENPPCYQLASLRQSSVQKSEYETLFRYVKPRFINPALLEDQNIPLKTFWMGMAFPVDSNYFEQYPLIYNAGIEAKSADVHPRSN